MDRFIIALLLASFIIGSLWQKTYRKIVHNTDPEAKCLDGSPAALYVHEGNDKKNMIIFFLGGGICGAGTLEATL